jgi:mRNA interferase MazF
VIWIDCSPQAGREMRDLHPFVVLSPRSFNDKTSLVVGLPMTTAAYNEDNPFAVPAGAVRRRGAGAQMSYVLCHQPKSFDWRVRAARAHPMGLLPQTVFSEVCACLNQIVQLSGD